MSAHNVVNERTGLLNGGQRPSKSDPMDLSAAQRYGILAALWLGTFIGATNTTMVATLMSAISSEYQAANQAAWLGTSFLLAASTFTPLYGRLCTLLGRRGAHEVALFFTSLGILLSGLAWNMETLIAARFITGIGGGGLFVTTGIVTSDMYSMRDRSLTQGVAAVINGAGTGIGGLWGGAIMDRLGWRWAFLLQLPALALSFILTTIFLNYETPGSSKNSRDVLKRIDYGGVFSLLILIGSSLFFLSAKYNAEYPWNHPYVISTLVIMAISLAAFVVIELYIAPEPIMPPFLLRQRIPILVSANNVLVAICNFTVSFFYPLWFETVKLDTAASAGAHIAPNAVSMALGSLFAGWLMQKTGKYKVLNIVFGILPTLATVLVATLTPESSEWLQWLAIVPLGFGNSVVLQTTLIALLASVDRPSMAVAMGFVQLFRGLGQVAGVSVASAIFQAILDAELDKRLAGNDKLIDEVKHSSEVVRHLPPELQEPVIQSYAVALRAVFIMATCCTFAAFLVRLPIPELSLDEDEKSRHGNDHNDSDSEPEPDIESPHGQTPRTATPSDEDEHERHDVAPMPIPGRPNPRKRFSTYQHTPMDVDRGRSARKLRNAASPRNTL